MKQAPSRRRLFDKLAVVLNSSSGRCLMTLYCGVDFHSRRQTVCYCNTTDGEVKIKDLHHYDGDVRSFYEQFKAEQVIVGYETSGYARWFEQMLFELGIEVWVGDATEISRLGKRRQKNDRRDWGAYSGFNAQRRISKTLPN